MYLLMWQKQADSLGDNAPYCSFYGAQGELGARSHGNVFLLQNAVGIGYLILLKSFQKKLPALFVFLGLHRSKCHYLLTYSEV